VTIGKGNVGGGLAELWREAGHDVTKLGREGGVASGADAVLHVVRDPRTEGFDSLAAYVQSLTGGQVAKALNANFARLYDRLADASETPGMVFASDDGAREVTETLIRDAGYDPVYAGDLSSARAIEDFIGVIFAVAGQRGPFFYRIY